MKKEWRKPPWQVNKFRREDVRVSESDKQTNNRKPRQQLVIQFKFCLQNVRDGIFPSVCDVVDHLLPAFWKKRMSTNSGDHCSPHHLSEKFVWSECAALFGATTFDQSAHSRLNLCSSTSSTHPPSRFQMRLNISVLSSTVNHRRPLIGCLAIIEVKHGVNKSRSAVIERKFSVIEGRSASLQVNVQLVME